MTSHKLQSIFVWESW